MGPLEELAVHHSDLRPYLHLFIASVDGYIRIQEPLVFPQTKRLTISHPVYQTANQCAIGIAGLAKLQFALGIPFERVVTRGKEIPTGMEERLRPWVGNAECCYYGPHEPEDESDDE